MPRVSPREYGDGWYNLIQAFSEAVSCNIMDNEAIPVNICQENTTYPSWKSNSSIVIDQMRWLAKAGMAMVYGTGNKPAGREKTICQAKPKERWRRKNLRRMPSIAALADEWWQKWPSILHDWNCPCVSRISHYMSSVQSGINMRNSNSCILSSLSSWLIIFFVFIYSLLSPLYIYQQRWRKNTWFNFSQSASSWLSVLDDPDL